MLAERLREQIQNIATGLLGQTSIPSVAAQQSLLDEVASDEWWIDATLTSIDGSSGRLSPRSLTHSKTPQCPCPSYSAK